MYLKYSDYNLCLFFQVQGLPTGKLTIAEKSLLSDALKSRNKIRALIELPEVIIKALHRNALSSKDAIEICMKILEVKIESLLYNIYTFQIPSTSLYIVQKCT